MDKNWFVVHTKPRKENVAMRNLERQGFTTYCPQTIQSKRRRQCWQKVTEPLFPRYLFIQLNLRIDDFAPIRSTLGVSGLVRFGNQPAIMPVAAIEAIQCQEQEMQQESNNLVQWKKGYVLDIHEGPFAGLKGIFQKKVSTERVLLLLEILGQQNRVSFNINCLAPNI